MRTQYCYDVKLNFWALKQILVSGFSVYCLVFDEAHAVASIMFEEIYIQYKSYSGVENVVQKIDA